MTSVASPFTILFQKRTFLRFIALAITTYPTSTFQAKEKEMHISATTINPGIFRTVGTEVVWNIRDCQGLAVYSPHEAASCVDHYAKSICDFAIYSVKMWKSYSPHLSMYNAT